VRQDTVVHTSKNGPCASRCSGRDRHVWRCRIHLLIYKGTALATSQWPSVVGVRDTSNKT
jgi:hypothetical protein